jgi:type II secretion system protein G
MPKTSGFTPIKLRLNRRNPGFTLVELLVVIAIIGILASIGLASFNSSQAKSRDAKRKADLQQIGGALELYYNDYGQYPASTDGIMNGCLDGISACTWGTSPFTDSKTTYMVKLPADPMSPQYNYYYNSTPVSGLNTSYVLYAHLEDSQDKNILKPPLSYPTQCGASNATCNYGISSANISP